MSERKNLCFGAFLVFVLPFLGAACGRENAGGSTKASGPRTVVLITLDTFRTDRIGAYGATHGATPHLDALANRGVRFERCLSVAPITLPAHASMLSGVDPIHHGLRVNGVGKAPDDLPLLQVAMKDAGYATGAFVSSVVLDRRYGLARGFDRYDDRQGDDRALGSTQRRGRTTVFSALSFLKELGDRPAFLWLHLFDAHAPYQAPSEFATRFSDPYLAEMAYVDACVGDLLSGLDAAGRGEDSLVAVISDHGEGLGDHGESTHTIFVYDTTIRVPFLLAGAGLPAGRTVAGTTSAISVAPTLLELCGVAIPRAMYGRSLAAVAREGELPPDSMARFESMATQFYYGFAPLSGLERDGGKLIVAPKPEFYRPLLDPGESNNLFESERKFADERKRDLDAFERAHEVLRPEPEAPSVAQIEEMRQLAYASLSVTPTGIDPKDGIAKVEEIIRAQLRAFDDPAGAAGDLDRFLMENEGVAEAWELLGDCRMRIGQAEAAAEAFMKAIKLRGDDAGLRVKLADSLLRRAKPEVARARIALTVALEKDAANIDAIIKLANLELQFEGDPLPAKKRVEALFRTGAGVDRAEAWVVLAYANLALKELVEAKAALEEGMTVESFDPSVWHAFGRLAEALGDSERKRTCDERERELRSR